MFGSTSIMADLTSSLIKALSSSGSERNMSSSKITSIPISSAKALAEESENPLQIISGFAFIIRAFT